MPHALPLSWIRLGPTGPRAPNVELECGRVGTRKSSHVTDTCCVSRTERAHEPSAGAVYAAVGIVLIVLGGFSLANTIEAQAFGIIGVGLIAGGTYATVAGAVARGIQLARR